MGLVVACSVTLAGYALAGDHPGKGMAAEHFQKMDSNADGKVSPDEHAAGAKQMFDTMDADKDGKVTVAEMEASHAQMHKEHGMGKEGGKEMGKAHTAGHKMEKRAAEKLKVIDTNGDGTLTAEEHATGGKTMFAKMDANQDGFLSKEEMVKGHAKMLYKKHKD